jgi:hypothetical protein
MNRPLPPTPQGAPHSSPASNPPPVPPKPFMPTPSPPAASPFIAHPGIPVRQASPLTIPNINNNPLLNLPTLPAIPMLDQTPNATMQKRIKQLEEELKLAKVENEKQVGGHGLHRITCWSLMLTHRKHKLQSSAKDGRSSRNLRNGNAVLGKLRMLSRKKMKARSVQTRKERLLLEHNSFTNKTVYFYFLIFSRRRLIHRTVAYLALCAELSIACSSFYNYKNKTNFVCLIQERRERSVHDRSSTMHDPIPSSSTHNQEKNNYSNHIFLERIRILRV